MSEKCCEKIFEGYHEYPCGRNGKVFVDGKWYCGVHSPDRKAARAAKASARWEEKQAQWRREHLAKEIGLILIDAGIDSVEKARALLA